MSELLHDAFLAKGARSKEKQWHGLNGHGKLLFLEAVSKHWKAWQENAAATVILPAEAKVIWRTLRKQGLQNRVMQSRFVLVVKNEGKTRPKIHWTRRRLLALSFLDTPIQSCWTFAETCREAINVFLAVSASKGREKCVQLTAAFLKGEFQDKDRVLYCWPFSQEF